MSYPGLRTLAWAGARWSRDMTLARETARTACQTQFAAPPEMFFLAPFAGFRLLGYCVAGVVLDWIDSGRPPLERTPGPMSQMRETAR
jgi:hypothetical protein